MLIVQSLVLGVFQGLTEFIPISSSAHLVIIPWLFGWTDPALDSLSFDVALHLGTLLAVIVFFWKDWVRLVGGWFKSIFQLRIGEDADRRMAWYLVLACIPGGIAGVLFEGKIEKSFHVNPIPFTPMALMAGVIALLGGLLWLVDAISRRTRTFNEIRPIDAVCIGLAQALAIFPGVSRSGSTITTGLALGLNRESAARFSFLLSAPIIAGAGLKSAYDLVANIRSGTLSSPEMMVFPIGFAAAAISGFLCIKVLLSFLQKYSYRSFAFYRFALAIAILTVALLRR